MVQKNRAKDISKFMMFSIKNFYLLIQEELLNKGLRFTKEYMDMSSKYREIIYHACKSLFFDEKDTFMKK